MTYSSKYISTFAAVVVVIGLIVIATLTIDTSTTYSNDKPCDTYSSWSLKNIPARCVSYFNK